MSDVNLERIEKAKWIIKFFGTHTLKQELQIKDAAISRWKHNGLPKNTERYLRFKYPNLEIWKESKSAE